MLSHNSLVWLGLASVRLYYTAPYRFGIDVSCTCPRTSSRYRTTYLSPEIRPPVNAVIHWLGLGSVRPQYKYTSQGPYDIKPNGTDTHTIVSSAKGCTAGRTRLHLVLQQHNLLRVFINKAWLRSDRQIAWAWLGKIAWA